MEKPVARGLRFEDPDSLPLATLMKSDKRPSEGVFAEKPFISITW
jgi:hypothetical protein